MNELSGNQAAWLALGAPALLGWFAALLGWLLAPHLGVDPAPMAWGLCAMMGWYILCMVVASGWLGIALFLGAF